MSTSQSYVSLPVSVKVVRFNFHGQTERVALCRDLRRAALLDVLGSAFGIIPAQIQALALKGADASIEEIMDAEAGDIHVIADGPASTSSADVGAAEFEGEEDEEDEDEEDESDDESDESDDESDDENWHLEDEKPPPRPEEELKMVLCVRQDLKMGKGKLAAQCCHAAVACFHQSLVRQPLVTRQYEWYGAAKIALKAPDEDTIRKIFQAAREVGLVTYLVADAGRTQIEAGERNSILLLAARSIV